MAMTPTVLSSVAATTAAATITSGLLSPAANALLIVAACTTANTVQTYTPASILDTLTGGSLTWTKYEVLHNPADSSCVAVFVAQCGATPGTGIVTVTFAVNSSRRVIHVVQQAIDFHTTTPVAQSKTGTGVATTLTVTLDATPAAGSLVLGFVCSRDSAITPGSGFTELVELVASTNTSLEVEYDNASSPAAVDWSDLNTATNTAVVLEIAEEIAAAGAPPIMPRPLRIWNKRRVA